MKKAKEEKDHYSDEVINYDEAGNEETILGDDMFVDDNGNGNDHKDTEDDSFVVKNSN